MKNLIGLVAMMGLCSSLLAQHGSKVGEAKEYVVSIVTSKIDQSPFRRKVVRRCKIIDGHLLETEVTVGKTDTFKWDKIDATGVVDLFGNIKGVPRPDFDQYDFGTNYWLENDMTGEKPRLIRSVQHPKQGGENVVLQEDTADARALVSYLIDNCKSELP